MIRWKGDKALSDSHSFFGFFLLQILLVLSTIQCQGRYCCQCRSLYILRFCSLFLYACGHKSDQISRSPKRLQLNRAKPTSYMSTRKICIGDNTAPSLWATEVELESIVVDEKTGRYIFFHSLLAIERGAYTNECLYRITVIIKAIKPYHTGPRVVS